MRAKDRGVEPLLQFGESFPVARCFSPRSSHTAHWQRGLKHRAILRAARHRIAASLSALFLVLAAGCQSVTAPVAEPLVARFYLEVSPGEPGVALQLPVSAVSITVGPKPVLVEYDIANAELARVELGQCLMLQLNPAAALDLHRLSAARIGHRLVLMLNDAPIGVSRIEQAMLDGTILVFVETPDAELPALVARLKRTTAAIVASAQGNRKR